MFKQKYVHCFLLLFFVFTWCPGSSEASITLLQSFTEEAVGAGVFGFPVANAGDVNGDGYDDILIGAVNFNNYTGRAYLFFGGSNMDNTADVVMDGDWGAFMGHMPLFGMVSGAGDVNGDGYDDIIVGAPGYNAPGGWSGMGTGRAYVFFGSSDMDNVADVIMTGESGGDSFGQKVSGGGDINGDGYDDVIVSALYHNSYMGRVYIFYGGTEMMNTPAEVLDGESPEDEFGYSVSIAGDVNNDGYDDLIIGARCPNFNNNAGRAYLFFGGSDMTDPLIFNGEDAENNFGLSVSCAGNVNGDEFDDVIIGASGYNSNAGRVYLYYGSSEMDNEADIVMDGDGTGDRFGSGVSDAGDVNNDGYDDILVNDPVPYHSSDNPEAHLFFGGLTMDDIVDITFTDSDFVHNLAVSGAGDVNGDGYDDIVLGSGFYNYNTGITCVYYGGASMNNIADVIMEGETCDNAFGFSVSNAGDVNGDNYDDIIVGTPHYSRVKGRAYIYFGGPQLDNTADIIMTGILDGFDATGFGQSVSGAGDVNGDGYDDVIVGDYVTMRAYLYCGSEMMDEIADLILSVGLDEYGFGCSVSGAGDVNNDGYDDIIVGSYWANSNSGWSTGRAYIYYGGIQLDNTADVILDGETSYINFGHSVSDAGDVNNDTFDDVIVGATGFNSSAGRIYIYYGSQDMDDFADVIIDGDGTYKNFGHSLSGAGDVNNDGFDDIIIGAYRHITITDQEMGRAYLYYGAADMDDELDLTLGIGLENTAFGYDVSGAGDINGDGYDDVIVGQASRYANDSYAYVFFGGTPVDNVPDVTITDGIEESRFAQSVSYAGDVNGDGIDDIIIGAPGYNYGNGKVYLYTLITTYTLTIAADPFDGGTTTPEAGVHSFNPEEVVPINATPSEEYVFVNWTGGVANPTSPSTTIIMDENKTIIANFKLPDEATETLITNIEEINLEAGLENSLVTKLSIAIVSLEEDNSLAAVYQINSFINQVNAQRGKKISEEDADELIALAQRIINAIQYDLAKGFGGFESGMLNTSMPAEYMLNQNFPNPFNPETQIRYTIPEQVKVRIDIYNVTGKKVITLVDGVMNAGYHSVNWDGKDNSGKSVSGGLYLCRIQAGSYTKTIRMLLMK